jgi:hypothetical protein
MVKMKFTVFITLFFTFVLVSNPLQSQTLLGNWQLVDFDGAAKIRNSPSYREADQTTKALMEAKIQYRLESTVYQFISNDSLYYTDFVNQTIIQKKSKVEVSKENILSFWDGTQLKKAKILDLDDMRLILQPIVEGENVGKFVFERIVKSKD